MLRRRVVLATCRALSTCSRLPAARPSLPSSKVSTLRVTPATIATFRRWNSSAVPGGCMEHYLHLKSSGEIQDDPRQEVCMKMALRSSTGIDAWRLARGATSTSDYFYALQPCQQGLR
eukprot:symbB.v1.2.009693.t1/scaffold620.1/size179776/11